MGRVSLVLLALAMSWCANQLTTWESLELLELPDGKLTRFAARDERGANEQDAARIYT